MSNEIACPICGKNEQSQKVSAIVMAGTQSYQASGPTGGLSFAGGKVGTVSGWTSISGYAQSALAKMLMPPEEPKKAAIVWGTWATIALCAFLTYLFSQLPSAYRYSTSDGILGIWIIIIVVAIPAIATFRLATNEKKRNTKAYTIRKQAWDQAITRWNRLYYCFRDDVVYDPETGKSAPPSQMYTLLYD